MFLICIVDFSEVFTVPINFCTPIKRYVNYFATFLNNVAFMRYIISYNVAQFNP